MQSTSNKVDSVQNKELLWSTLQESGAFAGVPGDQFQRVYAAFDRSVQEASRSMTGSLSDVNKHVIREFVQMLRTSTSTQQPQNPMQNITTQNQNPNQNQKKKKIEVVYRAEDLQNERASEFDRQFREKQAEMDSFLTLKKPTDVSFKDSELKEDKPIGDEMSRLIANELAARERELVQLKPEDIKRAQQWIGTTDNNGNNGNNNNGNNNNGNNNNIAIKTELPLITNFAKKSVSFSEEEHEMEHFEPNEKMNELNEFSNKNEKHFEETDFIFSKFKKISEPLTDIGLPEPNAPITLQQLYNKLLELEHNVNAKHAEIMEYLTNVKK
jgi:hypothetical protein